MKNNFYRIIKLNIFRLFDAFIFTFKINKRYSRVDQAQRVIWVTEIGSRDLIPRLCQAIALWEEYSIPSIVIHKHFIKKLKRKTIRNSIIIDKSATISCIGRLRHTKLNGGLNMVIPEELILCDENQSFIEASLNPLSLHYVDYILCDSEKIKSFLNKNKQRTKIVNILNPRFCNKLIDLYIKKYNIPYYSILNDVNQPYILINDRLSMKFSSYGDETNLIKNEVFRATSIDGEKVFDDLMLEEEEEEKRLIELINNIRKIKDFDDLKIIIRPHPAVSLTKYIDYFKNKLPENLNYKIIRKGTAVDSMKYADIIFHDNCTTAIEAYYCGIKNIFNFASKIRKGTSKSFEKILNPLGIEESLKAGLSYYRYNYTSCNVGTSNDIRTNIYKFLGSKMNKVKSKDLAFNCLEKLLEYENVKDISAADRWIDGAKKIEYISMNKEKFNKLSLYPLGKIGIQVGGNKK